MSKGELVINEVDSLDDRFTWLKYDRDVFREGENGGERKLKNLGIKLTEIRKLA
jgi:hypothetical protein